MKKKLVSIMLVAAMALSVVACGSSKGNSAKTDGTEAMASSVSKTPDNQISINLASEPQSIDPALNSAVDGGCMIVNSFAGLYTYDKDGKLIPPALPCDPGRKLYEFSGLLRNAHAKLLHVSTEFQPRYDEEIFKFHGYCAAARRFHAGLSGAEYVVELPQTEAVKERRLYICR